MVAVQRPPSPFAALFGGLTSARQVEEAEEEEEELVVEEEEEVEPARPASPFAALFGGISLGRSAPAAEPEEEEEEEITPEPTPAAPVAAAKPASPFAALFGGSAAAIQVRCPSAPLLLLRSVTLPTSCGTHHPSHHLCVTLHVT